MLNGNPKNEFMKSQAQIAYQMISHPFSILYKVSTRKGVPEEVRCHEIVFQAASQRDISLMYFPQSRIWSMALQAWKLDLSTKLEQIHTLEVDL